jgi:hypothetical protein
MEITSFFFLVAFHMIIFAGEVTAPGYWKKESGKNPDKEVP